MKFNQDMQVPSFLTSSSTQTGRRNLLEYSKIDVPRDLFLVEYGVNGVVDKDNFNYTIELIGWTATEMKFKLKFNSPLQVSTGVRLDNLKLTVYETMYFVSKNGTELQTQDAAASKHVPV